MTDSSCWLAGTAASNAQFDEEASEAPRDMTKTARFPGAK